MSATITNEVAGSSFEIGQAVHQQNEPAEAEVDVNIDITETTPEGDSVELSTPGASAENPPAQAQSPTYGPPAVGDRFRFQINNGMLDKSRRFTPLSSRFNGKAAATYSARESLVGQVSRVAGQGSVYSALFDLAYQVSRPDPSRAGTNVDARTELNRIADRNMALLSSL
jgi:hypothetical protein